MNIIILIISCLFAYLLTCFFVSKVFKKGKIKFTPDGYAICDKASSQNCNFFTGERIWLNSKTKWQKNL